MSQASSTILVVATGVAAPELNTAFLRQPHLRVVRCALGPDIVERARAEHAELAIVDAGDAAERALAPCRLLRADPDTAETRMILVVDAGARASALGVAADVLIEKPVASRTLFEAVQRFVALPARRHTRHAINLRFTLSIDGRQLPAFSRDLSLDGAFLRTDRALALGSRFPIAIALPGDAAEIRCGAVVRQVSGDHGTRGVGIEFEEFRDAEIGRLEAFLAPFERSRGLLG